MKQIDHHHVWDVITTNDCAWDIVVVGGGITGAGILREAARLGLRALLIEQQDFAWGTSSRSSKMVHGGLRYIAQGDIKLTKHSVQERERLISEAPGLVERLGYLFPIRKGQVPGKLLFNSLLKIYDKLAGIKTQNYYSRKNLLQRVSGLNPEKLKGASYYTDAITDDARMVMRVLHEAIGAGDHNILAGNYIAAEQLLYHENGNVSGVQVRNKISQAQFNVHAKVVINATGAWVDTLREPVSGERTIRPLRGSHIIIPHDCAPVQDALTLFHPEDKRAVFIFPWEHTTVIGTTDLDHEQTLEVEPSITDDEVRYLLTLVQQQFPSAKIQQSDIISTYSGVRPVISKDRHKSPSKEKRDHQVWIDKGLVSVSGGKLTTFRLIALDTLKAVLPLLDQPGDAFVFSNKNTIFTKSDLQPADLPLDNEALVMRLIGCYGNAAGDIVSAAKTGELDTIKHTRFCLAEVRWCARHESILQLDDLLLRRTRLGLLLPYGGDAIFPAIQNICAEELGWDNADWTQQLTRYKALWKKHYSLPTTP